MPLNLEDSVLAGGVVDVFVDGKECFGRDGVEHGPYLIVAGNALDAEESLGVVAVPGPLRGLLMSKEGRRLGEEHRNSTHAEVLHGVGRFDPVRRSGRTAKTFLRRPTRSWNFAYFTSTAAFGSPH